MGDLELDGLHESDLTQQARVRRARDLREPVGIAHAHLHKQVEQGGFRELAVHKAGRRPRRARVAPLLPRPGGHVVGHGGRVKAHMVIEGFRRRLYPPLMDKARRAVGLSGGRFFEVFGNGQGARIGQRLHRLVRLRKLIRRQCPGKREHRVDHSRQIGMLLGRDAIQIVHGLRVQRVGVLKLLVPHFLAHFRLRLHTHLQSGPHGRGAAQGIGLGGTAVEIVGFLRTQGRAQALHGGHVALLERDNGAHDGRRLDLDGADDVPGRLRDVRADAFGLHLRVGVDVELCH